MGCDPLPALLRHSCKVSIHAPAWGATRRIPARTSAVPGFNPRTRVGCDSTCTTTPASNTGFNPRTRVGCDQYGIKVLVIDPWFQSTHPRGVRLPYSKEVLRDMCVSIHAPAWGATHLYPEGSSRATLFQSTHPRGVRHGYPDHGAVGGGVSIHAPAWGATRRIPYPVRAMPRFNPRTRVGCDRRASRILPGRWCFNPRTRVGCDAMPKTRPRMLRGFNPRTRVGCDSFHVGTSTYHEKFQSTHPRGVRRGCWLHRRPQRPVSIHAPAWGATFAGVFIPDFLQVSIHAPAWGATVSMFYPVDSRD